MSWIDQDFPAAVGHHEITSETDDNYNCIAWAANNSSEWWSNLPGYKWPGRRTSLIEGLVTVFTSLGYEICKSSDFEDGFEKVAIYVRNGMWRHAARQLPSGKWTSKLGPDEDIEHDTPECLCGKSYGKIHCIMRKAKS